MDILDKKYHPADHEEKIYSLWENSGAFTPQIDHKKKPYTIIMPPPNANGSLHIGHAMFVTLEDIMTRYQRMLGQAALWLPGADHAGILSQVVFERELAKKGQTRYDLGREKFFKDCFKFTQNNKKNIYRQFKLLGASCDWTREKFTLDPDVTQVAYETFFQLQKDGLIYRDHRLVSWCPRCATALSDLEVNHREERSKLWYLKYPFKESSGYLTVATTRPETMLGDTAVAVNPQDKRFKNQVGKKLILPIVNREIPIIADSMVDPEFGTGAVKITPAHDPDDFAFNLRHNTGLITVIGFDGQMTAQAGPDFEGLKVEEARQKVLKKLHSLGLLEKEEDYVHRVGHCERCKTTVEPLVSLQWFMKMKPLAQKAIKAVQEEETKIIPKHFKKTYFRWLKDIQDWCLSRQLWWGHRLPIWYCGPQGLSGLQKSMNPDLLKGRTEEGCGRAHFGIKPPAKCSCGATNFIQDPDTFDTWFSSGQWPYSTLGYPDSKDFKYFYPTAVMETGYEILFFWVARMMMLGLYRTGQVPFKTVYLHGMVRDVFSQKMSKSNPETAVDPTQTINDFGADSLRLALIYGTSAGNDVPIGQEKIKAMRNFTNKLWNASRFIQMIIAQETKGKIPPKLNQKHLSKEDQEILTKLKKIITSTTTNLEKYRFGQATEDLYQFFWHDFCDQYIEYAKNRKEKTIPVLITVLITSLQLLHPFAPFVTETIYQHLKKDLDPKGETDFFQDPLLISSSWPRP